MSSWLICDRKLSQIPPDHIELYFNIVKGFPVVYPYEVAHHLWHHNSIPQVGLDWCWFFSRLGVLLGFFALEIESVVFVFDFWVNG